MKRKIVGGIGWSLGLSYIKSYKKFSLAIDKSHGMIRDSIGDILLLQDR
jgi:hypothetical protein